MDPSLMELPTLAFAQPSADEFLAQGSLAALLVMVAVRFVRQLAPVPTDGSVTAKRITALTCIAVGMLLGWLGVAPPVAPGLAGQLVGGFGVGGLAFFGAALLGPKARLEGGS